MRDNQSDGEGGWPRPGEYASPWAPRDEDQTARARWTGVNPQDGDTIAFGSPPVSSWDGQNPYRQDGGPAQAWYGNQAGPGSGSFGDQAGSFGSQAGSFGDQAGSFGDQAGQGFGAAGWAPGPPAPPPPPGYRGRSGHRGHLLVYVAVAAVAASIGAGVMVAVHHQGAAPSAGISPNQVPGPHDNAAGSGASSGHLNRAAVARKVDPGLVDITSTIKYNGETAEGTGMIISSSGLVLTNNHVIDGATVVRASLADPGSNSAQSYTAEVVGYDATDDVALLRLVGASGLTAESFGNSSQVTVGTPVLALGNAEGHGGARPAAGIINALDRSIQASDQGSGSTEDLNHMLQTNAAIQQGDSGGALANNAGQVIGMITAANTAGSGDGGTLGFAIPINSALSIARQIAAGRPSATVYIGLPGFLGVEVAQSSSQDPRQQAADEAQAGAGTEDGGNGLGCQTTSGQAGVPARIAPVAAGALVLGVLCDTAATSAGMVAGDVITAVDGQAVTTPGSLTSITARYHPGTIVSVIWVSLNGVEHTTRMLLGQGPAH